MKYLILALVSITLTTTTQAQYFSGEINFKVNIEGASGDQAEMMKSMMPSDFNFKFDGKQKMKFAMKGGMMAAMMGEIVADGTTGEAFMLKHKEKKAFTMPDDQEESSDNKPSVTKLSETQTIAGYKTQKYQVESMDKGKKETIIMWIAKDLNIAKPDAANMKGNANNFFVEGLDGFPLRVEVAMDQVSGTMVMQADKVEKKDYPASAFEIPSDYKVEEFNPKSMMGR